MLASSGKPSGIKPKVFGGKVSRSPILDDCVVGFVEHPFENKDRLSNFSRISCFYNWEKLKIQAVDSVGQSSSTILSLMKKARRYRIKAER